MAEDLPLQARFDDGSECRGSAKLAKQHYAEGALANTELGFEVVVAEELEKRGIYDASRLRTRKPEIYKACIKCLGRGVSAKMTAYLLGLDIRTVNALIPILEAEKAIPPYKERTVRDLEAIIGLVTDQLVDKAVAGKLGTIDLGILIEKRELLTGGATSRTEHVLSQEEEETMRFLAAARESLRDVTGTGLEGENLLGKGAVAGGLAALPEPRDEVPVIEVGGAAQPVQRNSEEPPQDSESVTSTP